MTDEPLGSCRVGLVSRKRVQFSSLPQLCGLFLTPWIAARQASLSITNSQSSPKLMPIELVMPSNHLILCRPLLLLPSILPSIRVFPNESTLHVGWPKYWSCSFSISPSNEHSRLISFRMDWLDLLAVQGTLMSLLQHHGSKASILQHSAFFIVQISHPYMTIGKTIALTRRTFVGKIMSLLFNIDKPWLKGSTLSLTSQSSGRGEELETELISNGQGCHQSHLLPKENFIKSLNGGVWRASLVSLWRFWEGSVSEKVMDTPHTHTLFHTLPCVSLSLGRSWSCMG